MKGISLLAKACAAALICTGVASAEASSGFIDSSKLNDKKVIDSQGNELGEIERLLVDPQSGQVQYAVIDVGNFLNQQGTEVAVPWQSLKVNREGGADDFKVQLDATKEKLESAPRFSEAEADRLFTPSGSQTIQKFWTVTVTESQTPQQQPQQSPQQGLPGSQPTLPSVGTPSDESSKSSGPGSYYQQNRQSIESSATDQNNYPAGRERETSPGSVTTPDSSSSSPSPAPSTTPPTSSTSPTDTSEAKPAGPAADETDTSTSIPSEPSTTP